MGHEKGQSGRVRVTGCVQCGAPYSDGGGTSMSKFIGWKLGSCLVRSNGHVHFTLLDNGARVNFLLQSEPGAQPHLLSAEIPLDVDRRVLDKLRCTSCCEHFVLGEASCLTG